ncbi:hypothetical protein HDU86_003349 [Geranomyces michiganensis]|nr:hypothetical protein HDU86_003349 [Geranomyces michiganensis]
MPEPVATKAERASGLFTKAFPSWRGKPSSHGTGKAAEMQSSLQLTLVEFLDSSTSVNALSSSDNVKPPSSHNVKNIDAKSEPAASFLVKAPASPAVKTMRRMSSWFSKSGGSGGPRKSSETDRKETLSSEQATEGKLDQKGGRPILRRCHSEARLTIQHGEYSQASVQQTIPPALRLDSIQSIREIRKLPVKSINENNDSFTSFLRSPNKSILVPSTSSGLEGSFDEPFPFVPTSSPLPPGPVSFRPVTRTETVWPAMTE